MNYGIKGVKRKQAALNSKNNKIKKMGVVFVLKALFFSDIAGRISSEIALT